MDIKSFREYCLAKDYVTEDFPFDRTTLVFRVGGKIFAFTNIDAVPFSCTLKCDPARAIELREMHDEITPGWHLNKKHWNTIKPSAKFDSHLFYGLVDHSYNLVFNSLTKSEKKNLLKQV
ncbi:MAG: MmcQ/YjbR family DNA-binding protein [Ignavibacteria bacterium]|nr:MmcQ/YjbR family DNA-binding protein [Ignavibacteria bacterium]